MDNVTNSDNDELVRIPEKDSDEERESSFKLP